MFHSPKARQAMIRAMQAKNAEDLRDSPRFELALRVKDYSGEFVERFGRLGINGCYFETDEILRLGQTIVVRVGLLGLGVEVEAQGQVVSVQSAGNHVGVAPRFSAIPFETERLIARWLDMMNLAIAQPAVG